MKFFITSRPGSITIIVKKIEKIGSSKYVIQVCYVYCVFYILQAII